MTNPKRGELKLKLGEKSYDCKLNMDVLVRIEQNLGGSLLRLANKMQEADISGLQMVSILTPVLRSSGEDLKDSDVKRIIWDAGVTSTITTCAEIIAFIVGGNEGDEGNGKSGDNL